MYRILIVEDNKDELLALNQYITKAIPDSVIDCASSFSEALSLINLNTYSCFFLDICLDEKDTNNNGINLAYKIRERKENINTAIIFITTINSRIREAVSRLHCFDYLEKPYSEADINTCLQSLLISPLCQETKLSFRDVSGIIVKFRPEDILYVNAKGHSIILYGINNSYEINRITIENICKLLGNRFIQCHKSYLINTKYIDSVSVKTQEVTIKKHILPIGRKYINNVKEYDKND